MNIHIERWQAGEWRQLAIVTASSDRSFVVVYDSEHAMANTGAIDARALSASVPVTMRPVTFERWPAFLRDLIPQGESRKRLARLLGVPDGPESDWTLLAHGGGNPVGHLRVREAADWLSSSARYGRGWALDDIVQREESFLDALEAMGPTPGGGSQGEWPKVMLTEGHDGLWHLDHELADADAKRHWIVKLPRRSEPVFDVILRAEAAYHQVACEWGMAVGETRYQEGALLIERFDRKSLGNGGVHRIAQESLYAAAGCLGIEAELNHRQACLKLKAIATAPEETILAYVWRDLLNLALGNRDNHGRNTAVQRLDDGLIQLAPLFDFAPMMMHPDGISRRMTWGQENGSRPDWRRVAEQLDEAQILPQARLLDRIPEWQDKLLSLPELLRRHDCPEPVMGRIVKPYEDCMQTLTEAR